MASDETTKAIAAIRESRPPATDKFTYLTIIESHLSPQVLPALNDILQDAELTQEIGWDLVFNLVGLQNSGACLGTIARLGNPREVILKVLESLELSHQDSIHRIDEEDAVGGAPGITVPTKDRFIALLGMLDILHKRIQTKHPSRFLLQTLQTIHRAYQPNQQMTAAVINLVHSLSGRQRPPLPTRKSSIEVSNLGLCAGAHEHAPDPEAERNTTEDPTECEIQRRLLLSFVTCILEAYVNGNDLAWAARLLEFYNPHKIVPGRRTLTASFREDKELLERDAIVGKLVALSRDLGLSNCSDKLIRQLSDPDGHLDPLLKLEDVSGPDDIALSTGGGSCLLAYWVFSSTVFDADQPQPSMYLFPDHLGILSNLIGDDPESRIPMAPGTAQAIITVGLWLEANGHRSANPATSLPKPTISDGPSSYFMAYAHSMTLIAFYHPLRHVRNAASTLAGSVFHADPVDEDRLHILYDLLENCEFAQLRALAVTWLREELLAASSSPEPAAKSGAFTTPQALETVQYVVFPNMAFTKDLSTTEALEYLAQHLPFLLQAANFALFLWGSRRWKHVLPANMNSTVTERWFLPLQEVSKAAMKAVGPGEGFLGHEEEPLRSDLEVLRDRLQLLGVMESFRAQNTAEKT